MSNLVPTLAQRLRHAVLMTPNNTRPEYVEEQWQLVAETIDLMIDKAVMELQARLLDRRALPTVPNVGEKP